MQEIRLSMWDVQNESIEMLNQVADICEAEGFTYYLAYGTLIGAVRHQGFIPWDDDVDIMMPRDDYNRFIDYFTINANVLKPLELFTPQNNENYPYMIARVSNSRYVLDVDNEKPYGIGIFIDIYPLDGMGETIDYAKCLKTKVNRNISLGFLSTRLHYQRDNTKSQLKMLLKYPAFLYSHIRGKNYFFDKIQKTADSVSYAKSNYIGCLVWGSDDGVKGIFKKELFDRTIQVPFGSYKFRIPENYDAILKQLYGDYMQQPSEKERTGHHFYKAYLR